MPKSKKRKTKKSRSARAFPVGQRGLTPQRQPGQPGGTMQRLGIVAPAESRLVSAHLNYWQDVMAGVPANTCILSVLGLQEALSRVGIPAEPITVRAIVDFQDGTPPAVLGSHAPSIENRSWSGHLAMWLPTLRRFADPTLYQVNHLGRGVPMTMGILIQLPSLEDLHGAEVEKNGAWVTYELVEETDPPSWEAARTPALRSLTSKGSSSLHAAIRTFLKTDPEGQEIAAEITDPSIRHELSRLGVRR